MNNRKIIILAALLAVQVVLIGVLYWPREAGQASEITVMDVEPSDIVYLQIADGYNSTITLQKEGEEWYIDPPESFPADSRRVKDALKKLAHLKSSRLVSTSKGSQGRLRVSDEKFNRKIVIRDSAGKEQAIFLGNAQGKGVYARNAQGDQVVFLDNLSFWQFATSPRSWWKTTVVDLDPSALKSVEVVNGNGRFVIARNSDGNWTAEDGSSLDQSKVRKLLGAVKRLGVSEYLKKDAKEKIEKPEVTLKLVPSKGEAVTLLIGPASDDKPDRLVKVSTDQHLIKVRGGDVTDISSANIEGLKKEQENKTVQAEALAQTVSVASGNATILSEQAGNATGQPSAKAGETGNSSDNSTTPR